MSSKYLVSKLGYVLIFLKTYKGLNSNTLRDEVKNVLSKKGYECDELEMALNVGK